MNVSANAFAPDFIKSPALGWSRFERSVVEAATSGPTLAECSVLDTVVTDPFFALRTNVLKSFQRKKPNIRLNELNLRGYQREVPGWIAMRVACLATAVEIMQIASNREPMFPRARPIVRIDDAARELIYELRGKKSLRRPPARAVS